MAIGHFLDQKKNSLQAILYFMSLLKTISELSVNNLICELIKAAPTKVQLIMQKNIKDRWGHLGKQGMFMKNLNSYLLIIFYLFSQTINSQFQNQSKSQYFIWTFSDDSIKIEIKLNKINLTAEDSLEINLLINNPSMDTICILSEIRTKSILKPDKQFIIEFGGFFEAGIETLVDSRIIPPDSSVTLFRKFAYKYFIDRGYGKYFLLKFSYGYIPHFSCLRINDYLGNVKSKYLTKDIIEISSILFES